MSHEEQQNHEEHENHEDQVNHEEHENHKNHEDHENHEHQVKFLKNKMQDFYIPELIIWVNDFRERLRLFHLFNAEPLWAVAPHKLTETTNRDPEISQSIFAVMKNLLLGMDSYF